MSTSSTGEGRVAPPRRPTTFLVGFYPAPPTYRLRPCWCDFYAQPLGCQLRARVKIESDRPEVRGRRPAVEKPPLSSPAQPSCAASRRPLGVFLFRGRDHPPSPAEQLTTPLHSLNSMRALTLSLVDPLSCHPYRYPTLSPFSDHLDLNASACPFKFPMDRQL